MKNIYILLLFLVFVGCNIWYAIYNFYDEKKYELTVGGEPIAFYLKEEYTLTSIPIFVHIKNYKNEFFYPKSKNEVSLSNLQFDFKMIACYNIYNQKRISCSSSYQPQNKPKEKELSLTPSKLVIQKGETILYEGDYITDFSPYLTEEGRYYFTIDVHEKHHLGEKTISKIMFQLKVVGDPYE